MQGEMCEEFVKSYKFIKHKLYDIRVKRSKSRSCLHGKAFELGTRQTWGSSDLRSKSADSECLRIAGAA